jgi:hypothetical protein
MLISECPFIVKEKNRFYSGEWINIMYSNVFDCIENKITVCTFRNEISFTKPEYYNPLDILILSVKLVLSYDSLLFYHDFSGINPNIAENYVKKNIKEIPIEVYRSKICIDISRGMEGNCFPSFDRANLYPIIKRNKKLLHIDPRILGPEEKKKLYQKFRLKRFDGFNYKIKLFENENVEYILFEQLIEINKIDVLRISNAIFPIIRQLQSNNDPLANFTWSIEYLKYILDDYPEIKENYLNIINQIEYSKHTTELIEIKSDINEQCYIILKYFIKNICNSFGLSIHLSNDLIDRLKNHPNLYQLNTIYKEFFESHYLI